MKNLIGKSSINFKAPAVLADGKFYDDFDLHNYIRNSYALLFFYPLDFTYVCPSELISLNNRYSEFASRNIKVIAISIDSKYVHKAWRDTSVDFGGIGNDIKYVLVSDIKKEIMKAYGVEDDNSGVSFRGSFFIDLDGRVRIQHIHDFPFGRNIDEYLRLFDSLIFNKENGNVCQAGWIKGSSGIIPSSEGIKNFLSSNFNKL